MSIDTTNLGLIYLWEANRSRLSGECEPGDALMREHCEAMGIFDSEDSMRAMDLSVLQTYTALYELDARQTTIGPNLGIQRALQSLQRTAHEVVARCTVNHKRDARFGFIPENSHKVIRALETVFGSDDVWLEQPEIKKCMERLEGCE